MSREIIFYKDYFYEFYNEQELIVQKKVDWTLGLVRDLPMIPEKYFSHMEGTDGLFEIRVKVGSNIYRIFSFFNKGNLVVLANGFQKKTQKTPKNELERALRIKKEYEDENK